VNAVKLGSVRGQHPQEAAGNPQLEVSDDDAVDVLGGSAGILEYHPRLIPRCGGEVDARLGMGQEVMDAERARDGALSVAARQEDQ
jgi:hypothetical protein